MSGFLGIEQARSRLGDLCRQTALGRERTAITEDGTTLAVLISPQELADLEDELALARNRLNEARGFPDPVVTQDELLAEFAAQDAAEGWLSEFRGTDRDGVDQVLDAINLLRADPHPPGSHPYGSGYFRIHVGAYRVLYQVRDGVPVVISVETVGRIP